MPPPCSNCQAEIVSGGLRKRRLCARCNQYQRRHDGELPPPVRMRAAHRMPIQVTVRFLPEEKALLTAAARAANARSAAAWIRRLISHAIKTDTMPGVPPRVSTLGRTSQFPVRLPDHPGMEHVSGPQIRLLVLAALGPVGVRRLPPGDSL